MRDEVEDSEENKVEVRKDDKTIAKFTIPFENLVGPIVTVNNVELMNRSHDRESFHLQQPIVAKK
jgi:hypothetical protein